jgi:glutaredoxin
MTDVMFLYFKDCPNWKKALKSLNMILSEEGVNTRVRKIQIRSEEEAVKRKFTGSPTIRIDGKDIDPSYRDTGAYVLACRNYPGGPDEGGLPPEEMIRRAVRVAFPL